ncbi:hypothetical protein OsI_36428 [Oryza sativa Indica Group]|uniref:Uncharacterized protein n=1 Tax=Oryza sativa subsp. indica TaxID=39946 RepID=B8BKZ3_ORYSI|nr:hypothetical protein OsI_36428 [Oryza sativa Indica Group]
MKGSQPAETASAFVAGTVGGASRPASSNNGSGGVPQNSTNGSVSAKNNSRNHGCAHNNSDGSGGNNGGGQGTPPTQTTKAGPPPLHGAGRCSGPAPGPVAIPLQSPGRDDSDVAWPGR